VIKYGFEGYGLYWYCVENICSSLEPRLSFELEADAEILAHVGRMDSRLVEEIMAYMINLGLFEQSHNIITCLKLARFLGESGTRNGDLKQIIRDSKSEAVSDSLKLSQTVSDCPPKIREDKRRKDIGDDSNKNKRFTPPTIQEVTDYCKSRGYTFDPETFVAHHATRGWKLKGGQSMKCWKSACTTFQKNEEKWNQQPQGMKYL